MPKASNTHHSKSIRPWCNRWIKIKVLTLVRGSHSAYVIVLLFGKYMFCLHNTLRSWPAPPKYNQNQTLRTRNQHADMQSYRHVDTNTKSHGEQTTPAADREQSASCCSWHMKSWPLLFYTHSWDLHACKQTLHVGTLSEVWFHLIWVFPKSVPLFIFH